MGFSPFHSSDVPLVLNLQTGSITPQFHFVFDYHFSTIPSVERETDPPDHWADLCLDNAINITTDDTTNLTLHDDWLTDDERLLKSRIIACNNAIQASMSSVIPLPNAKSTNISLTNDPSKTSQRELVTNTSPTNQREPIIEQSPTIQKETNTELSSELSPSQTSSSESSSLSSPNIFPKPTMDLIDSTSSPVLRQSSRSNKGISQHQDTLMKLTLLLQLIGICIMENRATIPN
jgi:type II secretory pathway pseudopilin PulG